MAAFSRYTATTENLYSACYKYYRFLVLAVDNGTRPMYIFARSRNICIERVPFHDAQDVSFNLVYHFR